METRDLLLTIAEVAIAFTGFASLAAVLATRSEQTAMLNAMRFRSMLMYSLTTATFCFVPFVPPLYGFSTSASWNTSLVLLAVVVATENLVLLRLYGGVNPAKVSRSFLICMIVLVWLPVVLAVLGLLGVGAVIGNYVLALLAVLLASAWSFLRVISALLIPIRRD